MAYSKIMTLKVDGLNNILKRHYAAHFVISEKVDIICLKEMHISKNDEHLL